MVVSDSTGETGEAIARAWISQFPQCTFELIRYSGINSIEEVDDLMQEDWTDAIAVASLILPEVCGYFKEACRKIEVPVIDLFDRSLQVISDFTGASPSRQPGRTRELTKEYFLKIASIEFAVQYDDGKDHQGFLKADIILLGVSRTSKTPLSMFLANKGYNVANLPLVPELRLPKEIFLVDPRRVIGLTIDIDRLNEIRIERLKSMGLPEESNYANNERIQFELDYAKKTFDTIGCDVLDVSKSTIEETATKVLSKVTRKLGNEVRKYGKA